MSVESSRCELVVDNKIIHQLMKLKEPWRSGNEVRQKWNMVNVALVRVNEKEKLAKN